MIGDFSVLTFNILAPIYNERNNLEGKDKTLYFERNQKIIDFLISHKTDIICLQEFWVENEDFRDFYQERFKKTHPKMYYLMRTKNKKDGLCIFITERFNLKQKHDFKFFCVGNRVAIFLELEDTESKEEFIIINTHLTFPHSHFDEKILRMEQAVKILNYLENLVKDKDIPVILVGDLNCPGKNEDLVLNLFYEKGFLSTYHQMNKINHFVSHLNHADEEVGADFILFRGKKLEPIESILLEKGKSDQKWDKSFTLSDHRPLRTVFKWITKLVKK